MKQCKDCVYYGFKFDKDTDLTMQWCYEPTNNGATASLLFCECFIPKSKRTDAHWVFGKTMGHCWMKCSSCCVSQSGHTGCWSYCPNCGAEMIGEPEYEN